jgi:hypothetical protein
VHCERFWIVIAPHDAHTGMPCPTATKPVRAWGVAIAIGPDVSSKDATRAPHPSQKAAVAGSSLLHREQAIVPFERMGHEHTRLVRKSLSLELAHL